jgi:hypothetical protein
MNKEKIRNILLSLVEESNATQTSTGMWRQISNYEMIKILEAILEEPKE